MVGVSDVVCPGAAPCGVASHLILTGGVGVLKLAGHIERRIYRYAEIQKSVFLYFTPVYPGGIFARAGNIFM